MSKTLKIVIAQLNFLVGDITGNAKKVLAATQQARDELHGDLIVFPELALTSYPPEDVLLRPDFLALTRETLNKLATEVQGITAVIGYPHQSNLGLFNAAAVLQDGKIIATYYKQHLPNYGVFDEKRYFITGSQPCVVPIKGVPIGITICEDLWYPDPMEQAVQAGAQIVCSLNASPYDMEKPALREQVLRQRIEEGKVPVVYVHGIGAQDELVFDGGSMVLNANGELCAHADFFKEKLLPVEFTITNNVQVIPQALPAPLSEEASAYQALTLGVKDYIEKNNFPSVIVGVSGGLDSALTLAIAVDALGKDRVQAVLMPSRYTSDLSMDLAKKLAELMGVKYKTVSIEPSFNEFLNSLNPILQQDITDVAAQNLQARCRGVILMALSNISGSLVLTTGNKSEMAVGYATLYGDMAGGFAVLKDVYKTLVYRLAAYRNSISPVIPQEIIDRAPTAELAYDQKDEDTLPPYPILDKILKLYVENDFTEAEIIHKGFAAETVKHVITLVNKNEYKRRQAAPGIKITPRAFGRDRRYPITSGYRLK